MAIEDLGVEKSGRRGRPSRYAIAMRGVASPIDSKTASGEAASTHLPGAARFPERRFGQVVHTRKASEIGKAPRSADSCARKWSKRDTGPRNVGDDETTRAA